MHMGALGAPVALSGARYVPLLAHAAGQRVLNFRVVPGGHDSVASHPVYRFKCFGILGIPKQEDFALWIAQFLHYIRAEDPDIFGVAGPRLLATPILLPPIPRLGRVLGGGLVASLRASIACGVAVFSPERPPVCAEVGGQ